MSTPETVVHLEQPNPIHQLNFEPRFEALGEAFYSPVAAAEFPMHLLRFRNDAVLQQLGLDPSTVSDRHIIEALGQFQGRSPLLAMAYHGYQFGEYNPRLGDGRGFLYGQVRSPQGILYDLGTKGSGTTPYARSADGRLTLKGGVREVLAAETLHHLGVNTSRCLSLIETGESLWRGDEPSPTRASVMVRCSQSHIRFGTFERLLALQRPDLVPVLLDHVIDTYYGQLTGQSDRYPQFYAALVERTAALVAQWMSVGFCHAVLNTDNMSITGESFDYGPYAFIQTYDLTFTAAYFDYMGRYCYGNQPSICHWNLRMLQRPLIAVISQSDLDEGLSRFEAAYHTHYRRRMLAKLGFETANTPEADELLAATIQFLQTTQVDYHGFFAALRQDFSELWQTDPSHILREVALVQRPDWSDALDQWRSRYFALLQSISVAEQQTLGDRLRRHNPLTIITRPVIEAVWEPIAQADDWQPFYNLLANIQAENTDAPPHVIRQLP